MYKAAVIGDYDSIYGFGALGLDVFPTDGDLTQAAHQLRRLCEGNYAVVYITEALAQELSHELEHYSTAPPAGHYPHPRGNGQHRRGHPECEAFCGTGGWL